MTFDAVPKALHEAGHVGLQLSWPSSARWGVVTRINISLSDRKSQRIRRSWNISTTSYFWHVFRISTNNHRYHFTHPFHRDSMGISLDWWISDAKKDSLSALDRRNKQWSEKPFEFIKSPMVRWVQASWISEDHPVFEEEQSSEISWC